MNNDARQVLVFLAEGYEKLARSMEANAEQISRGMPANSSEVELAHFAGYAQGQIKAYRDMAYDLRQVLRDNPPSRFNWPRIALGVTWRF
jgi:hypothetical protein